MSEKKIYVRTSERSKSFTWSSSSGSLYESRDGKIGTARQLSDAIELAKSYTGGSYPKVEIQDA